MKPYISTMVACLVVAVVTAPVHGGLILVLLMPFIGIWMIVNLYRAWLHPACRCQRLLRIALWSTTICMVLVAHWRYASEAREAGQSAVRALVIFKAAQGVYPRDMASAGIAGKSRWRVYYALVEGQPFLMYPATFVPFDVYTYDFNHGTWKYQPD